MSPADQHIRMVLSILMSLIVVELLSKARLAADTTWGKPQFHWLPFAWAGVVLLTTLQLWWFLFGYLELDIWSGSFLAFLELLLSPALLYVAAASIFPAPAAAGAPADLSSHFYRRRGWIFIPLALVAVEPMLGSLVAGGSLWRPQTVFQVLFAGAGVTAALSGAKRLHTMLPMVVIPVLVGFIVVFRSGLE